MKAKLKRSEHAAQYHSGVQHFTRYQDVNCFGFTANVSIDGAAPVSDVLVFMNAES
ncbi:MAG: hypothetical protein WCE26_13535 [Candidatus Acidiferrales bacterium]